MKLIPDSNNIARITGIPGVKKTTEYLFIGTGLTLVVLGSVCYFITAIKSHGRIKEQNDVFANKQKEIEIHGNISDKVLKSGLISNIVFVGVVTLIVGIIGTIVFGITYLISDIYWTMAVAIISLCVILFAITILLTLKFMQKLNIGIAIKLRKYTVNKKSGKILLVRK